MTIKAKRHNSALTFLIRLIGITALACGIAITTEIQPSETQVRAFQ